MTADAAALKTCREAGKLITAPRLAVAQFFDIWLAEADRARGLPLNFLHALLMARRQLAKSGDSAGDLSDAGTAWAMALLALAQGDARLAAAQAAIASGLFDPPARDEASLAQARGEAAALIARLFPATATDGAANAGGLQSLAADLQFAGLEAATAREDTFANPDLLVPAFLRVRQRLCKVRTATQTGTGFLIGPSAVLTNLHVVADVPRPRADTSLSAVFDYSRTSGEPTGASPSIFEAEDDWCLASSDHGALQPDGVVQDQTWWADDGLRQQWRTMVAGHLDFAIIRLRGAPGLLRGWYDLAELSRLGAGADGSCYVLQHPGAAGRSLTAGRFVYTQDTDLSTRAFHTATTAHGSSGGLLLNAMGLPVALHYYGLGRDIFKMPAGAPPPQAPQDVVNVAIPLASIAQSLDEQTRARIGKTDILYLPNGSLEDGRPVFGRRKLLDALAALAQPGGKQILRVHCKTQTVRKPGKSYTSAIIKTLFPAPEHHLHMVLTPQQVKPKAFDMASQLLDQIRPGLSSRLSQPDTTDSAYGKTLVQAMRTLFEQHWPDVLIWLIIDDLDSIDLPDAGGKEFLNTLYSSIRQIPQMRIVLIGLSIRLDSIKDNGVDEEIVSEDFSDVANKFSSWMAERGGREVGMDPMLGGVLSSALASYAGTEEPYARLADFTATHLNAALSKAFGR
jgi:hypothetical protein